MKYSRKPGIVKAFQYFYPKPEEDESMINHMFIDAILNGMIIRKEFALFVATLEGHMKISDGDWIVKGIMGEMWPVKPDIFEQTYDKVE